MSVKATEEEYEHIELFGKPGLFTDSRIDRDTVPQGWYCYDLRGSDYDPAQPVMIENYVVVNHAGSILIPSKVDFKDEERIRIGEGLNFTGEHITVKDFCKEHDLQMPEIKRKYVMQPTSGRDVGYFYAAGPELDKQRGCIGHVRIDFGHGGHEFWHTWWPRGPEEWNSSDFKRELTEVVNELREGVLKSLQDMRRFCNENGGEISGGWSQNYGYEIDTDRYRYCLRCNPVEGD